MHQVRLCSCIALSLRPQLYINSTNVIVQFKGFLLTISLGSYWFFLLFYFLSLFWSICFSVLSFGFASTVIFDAVFNALYKWFQDFYFVMFITQAVRSFLLFFFCFFHSIHLVFTDNKWQLTKRVTINFKFNTH